jgi:hypothetical protein
MKKITGARSHPVIKKCLIKGEFCTITIFWNYVQLTDCRFFFLVE